MSSGEDNVSYRFNKMKLYSAYQYNSLTSWSVGVRYQVKVTELFVICRLLFFFVFFLNIGNPSLTTNYVLKVDY